MSVNEENVVNNNTTNIDIDLGDNVSTDDSDNKKDIKLAAVMYTDGSARPTNPGFTGWGSHGYIYKDIEVNKPINVDGYIITNKGYISPNKLNEENAIPIHPITYIDGVGSNEIKGSNNAAELQAVYYSLKYLENYNISSIYIYSDSEYVIRGINEKCEVWNRYNWVNRDGSNIANIDLWKDIYTLVLSLKSKGINFNISWVKAHVGNFGNEQADSLAVTGMNYSTYQTSQNNFIETTAKDYWGVEKHPFLSFKRIYFNSVSEFNKPGQYYQADSGSGDYVIGKRIPESGFSVIRLSKHEDIIESVKHKQFDVANDVNAIIMMMLDKVYSKDLYRYIKNHGKHCLLKSNNSLGVTFTNKKPVTVEINPTGLSLRALESLNYLEEILDKFLLIKHDDANKLTTMEKINWHDITGILYNIEYKVIKGKEQAKYTLSGDLNVGCKDIKLTIDEPVEGGIKKVTVPMILGLDLLPRNNLKKIEDQNPKVYLITWRESAYSIRYATVIECSTGVGIWSNFFADKIIL